jgi:hypothetical protein
MIRVALPLDVVPSAYATAGACVGIIAWFVHSLYVVVAGRSMDVLKRFLSPELRLRRARLELGRARRWLDARTGGSMIDRFFASSLTDALQMLQRTTVCTICYGEQHALIHMVSAGSAAASSSAAPGCGHPFCIECMHEYVCTCVASSKHPVRCPSPGCSETLAHQDIVRLLRHSPAHMKVRGGERAESTGCIPCSRTASD